MTNPDRMTRSRGQAVREAMDRNTDAIRRNTEAIVQLFTYRGRGPLAPPRKRRWWRRWGR